MANTKPKEKTAILNMRIKPELMEAIDKATARVQQSNRTGVKPDRTAAITQVLESWAARVNKAVKK